MKTDEWRLDYRPGGWIRAVSQTGFAVYFRLRPEATAGGERLRIRTAIVDSPAPITARTWREAPFTGAENHALVPQVAEILNRPAETDADGAAELGRYFDATAGRFGRGGSQVTDRIVSEPGEPPADFRRVQAPGGHLTDDFLGDVAAAYTALTAREIPPAPAIAEMSGAPVRTVHRWILTARRRGFLPPAIKGRAG